MSGSPGKPATERLFVALELPRDVAAELVEWAKLARAGLDGVRVLPRTSLHLTLAFLGNRDPSESDLLGTALERRLDPASTGPRLESGPPLWLPRRRPRALTIAMHDPAGALAALVGELDPILAESIGWRRPSPLKPHVTVARTGRGFDPPHRPLPVTPQLGFAARSVTLYRSRLLPEGAEYEPLASVAPEGPSA